ncbi:MAG: hypothetical protein ACREU3_17165 [Steroidobacteraceae bacterium]
MASPLDGTAWTRSTPAARPLRALDGTTVRRRLAAAIAAGDGMAGAHCIHELWMRAELAVDIDAELERLWGHAARSIPEWLPMRHIDWLPIAYDVAASFRSRRRGKSNVYLILLDCHDRRNGPYGAYVGMSDYPPAQRFDQHKQGIRASGSVLKRGIEVLVGPTLHLQHIGRSEAARIEAELAVALADAGLIVAGGH